MRHSGRDGILVAFPPELFVLPGGASNGPLAAGEFSPLFVLLFTLLKLKWKAKDAGATALFVALLVGGLAFGGHIPLLAVACAKGVSLTLFVVLIIWTSGFMYQMVHQTGSVPVYPGG